MVLRLQRRWLLAVCAYVLLVARGRVYVFVPPAVCIAIHDSVGLSACACAQLFLSGSAERADAVSERVAAPEHDAATVSERLH